MANDSRTLITFGKSVVNIFGAKRVVLFLFKISLVHVLVGIFVFANSLTSLGSYLLITFK